MIVTNLTGVSTNDLDLLLGDVKKFTGSKVHSFLSQEIRNRMNKVRQENLAAERCLGRLDELFEMNDLMSGVLASAIGKELISRGNKNKAAELKAAKSDESQKTYKQKVLGVA